MIRTDRKRLTISRTYFVWRLNGITGRQQNGGVVSKYEEDTTNENGGKLIEICEI